MANTPVDWKTFAQPTRVRSLDGKLRVKLLPLPPTHRKVPLLSREAETIRSTMEPDALYQQHCRGIYDPVTLEIALRSVAP